MGPKKRTYETAVQKPFLPAGLALAELAHRVRARIRLLKFSISSPRQPLSLDERPDGSYADGARRKGGDHTQKLSTMVL